MSDEGLWDDERHYGNTTKTYFRTWAGMGLRTQWNASPYLQHCQTCHRCGYKWDEIDFTYADGTFTNDTPNPVKIHKKCWHCWMADTNHAQVREYWDKVDADKRGPVKAESKGGLKKPSGNIS